ncbi:diguanylate cyclase domain-containing protein [Bradyrhizobium sp. 2TAF24]|uniref:diguanylate cyclase domain-containing protein n=1 Tax=Bradyrhizobium sp. 2TAF24 TaxID=3233011 RepID=UPI003F93DDFC
MGQIASSMAPRSGIRRELIEMLYTALPQVAATAGTSIVGAVSLAVVSGGVHYVAVSCAIALTAFVRLYSLWAYQRRLRHGPLSDAEVLRWEHIYGAGAAAFAVALGMLSACALWLGDAPGAWIAFGLSISFCVGMVSRAAVRPWIVLLASALLLTPTIVAGLSRPEMAYKLGACMLVLFWITLREASRHLSTAFIERLEAKQALARQAHQDFLTGLPNRAAFCAALDAASGRVAIVAIDLDGFKPVNDRLGHQAGDQLLQQVAERLTECIAPDSLVARFGGDEFMLLSRVDAGPAGEDAALAVTKRVVSALSLPFHVCGEPVRIAASAGILISEAPAALPAGAAARLLDQADQALYAAKRAGGGQWRWSTQDSVPLAPVEIIETSTRTIVYG